MASPLVILFYFLAVLRSVLGLQVTPGSECAALCLDDPESDPLDSASSSTNASDIACSDSDYSDSSTGIKFKNCIDCLQESRAEKDDESDTQWFLYNLRYSVDVCLFGFPNTTKAVSSPCNINYACQPLKASLETGILNPSNAVDFGYCDADGGHFNGTVVDACVQCLQASDDQEYMANFITALRAGCQQRPQQGALVGLSGSLFSEYLVNITTPPTNETIAEDGSATTVMTTGAIVGIAVGAALLFLGGTALFWVYYRKQKKLHDTDFVSRYDPRGGSTSGTPPLKGPYAAFDSKPGSITSQYELRAQTVYGQNVDDYAELEKEMPGRQPNYHFDPNQALRGPSSALPVHPAYVPRSMGRAGMREPSPEPPVPVRSNRPGDYAPSTYNNAPRASAAPAIHAPILAPAIPASVPFATSRDSYHMYRHSRQESLPAPPPNPPPPTLSRGPSPNRGPTQPLLPGPPPPPPPPPRAPKLTLPSIPKLRGAKKYQPPQIVVEDATPIAGPGESVPIGLEISNPLTQHRQRFANETTAGVGHQPVNPSMLLSQQHHGPIRTQSVLDRRETEFDNLVTIHTGKSTMFG